MAFAATQITKARRAFLGNGIYLVTGKFTGPASYTGSGGDALSAANAHAALLGANEIFALDFLPAVKTDASAVRFFAYDITNKKIMAFTATSAGGQVEVTNATDLSTYVCNFTALVR